MDIDYRTRYTYGLAHCGIVATAAKFKEKGPRRGVDSMGVTDPYRPEIFCYLVNFLCGAETVFS